MGPKQRATRRAKAAAKQAEYDALVAKLRATGAACRTCTEFKPYLFQRGENYCERHSDSEGYVMAKPSGLCPSYRPKETTHA